MTKTLFMIGAFLLVWTGASAQRTIPMTLKGMVQQAGTIVHAVVTDTKTGKDPVTGMPATWVTVDVRENFYGAPSSSFTFKQVGGKADGLVYYLAELPQFTPGEEVVMLPYPEHEKSGFSSPVGMGQGKFVVRTRPAPLKKVVDQVTPTNELMKSGAPAARPGELSFEVLTDELRTLVRTEKGGAK